jgi:hypothetical protein
LNNQKNEKMEIISDNEKRSSLIEKLERRVEERMEQRGTLRKAAILNGLVLFSFIALFFILGYALRWLDPLSALLDGGVIMLLLLGAIAVMMGHIWAVWATQSILMELLISCRDLFGEPVKLFTSWQIIFTYGAAYFLFFWSFLWCFSMWL